MIAKRKILFIGITLLTIMLMFSGNIFASESLGIYWNSNHDYEAYKDFADRFAKENNIKIDKELFLWPDLTKRLLADFTGNTESDLVELPASRVLTHATRGNLKNIADEVKEWKESDDWFDATWEEVSIGDKIYGLKLHHTAMTLFYNKDLFKEAGLDPNQPPETMKDFMQTAKHLSENLSDDVKAFGFDNDAGYMATFLATQETPYLIDREGNFLIDNENTRKVLRNLKSLIQNDYALVPDPGADYQVMRKAFINEKAAMIITGPWSIGNINEGNPDMDYGVAMVPYIEGTTPLLHGAGTAMVIPENAKNPDLAWEFMKGITDPQIEVRATLDTGMLMPRNTWANHEEIQKNTIVSNFSELLDKTTPFFNNSAYLGLSKLIGNGTHYETFYEKLLYTNESSDESLDWFINISEKYIERELRR